MAGREPTARCDSLTTTSPSSLLLCTPSTMTTIPARLARTTAVSVSPTHARQRVLQLYRDWYRAVRRPAFLPPPPSPWTHPRVSSKHCNQTNILPLKNFLRSSSFPYSFLTFSMFLFFLFSPFSLFVYSCGIGCVHPHDALGSRDLHPLCPQRPLFANPCRCAPAV